MAADDTPLHGTREDLRTDYAETHSMYRMLVDIRFKLLTFVPTASGVAIGLLGEEHLEGDATGLALGIGVLGLLVTLGVIIYEVRNSQIHDRAIHRLKHLEKLLGFRPAVIAVGPGGFFAERGSRLSVVGIELWHDRALGLIYGSVVGAWVWLIYANLGARSLMTLPGPDIDEIMVPVVVGVAVAWRIVALSATGRSAGPIYELVPIDPGIARGGEIISRIVREVGERRNKELRTDRTAAYLAKRQGSENDWTNWLALVRGVGLIETTRVGVLRRARPRRGNNDSRAEARGKARRRWRLTAAGSRLNDALSEPRVPFVPNDDVRKTLLTAFRAGVVGFDEVWRQRVDPHAPDPVERYGRRAPWCTQEEIVHRVAWVARLQPDASKWEHGKQDQP